MKFSLVALFSLPAALAAPQVGAPIPSKACACANEFGGQIVNIWCQYQIGAITNIDGEDWCFPATTYAPEMPTRFNDELCPQVFPGYTTGVCRDINLCSTGYGDVLQVC
ncbi:hypothetical protein B0I35DRAFT_414798 [Stachybotrys elegans]|uniref:Uncharacterized protein n=1 Tax=Stachybotrys elegans TaxID=80388 RepID=A0A8K0WJG3_9HYPO|nr:hypothetical protein B0I35DRAFT_414798 [Stachybotrys elegans]